MKIMNPEQDRSPENAKTANGASSVKETKPLILTADVKSISSDHSQTITDYNSASSSRSDEASNLSSKDEYESCLEIEPSDPDFSRNDFDDDFPTPSQIGTLFWMPPVPDISTINRRISENISQLQSLTVHLPRVKNASPQIFKKISQALNDIRNLTVNLEDIDYNIKSLDVARDIVDSQQDLLLQTDIDPGKSPSPAFRNVRLSPEQELEELFRQTQDNASMCSERAYDIIDAFHEYNWSSTERRMRQPSPPPTITDIYEVSTEKKPQPVDITSPKKEKQLQESEVTPQTSGVVSPNSDSEQIDKEKPILNEQKNEEPQDLSTTIAPNSSSVQAEQAVEVKADESPKKEDTAKVDTTATEQGKDESATTQQGPSDTKTLENPETSTQLRPTEILTEDQLPVKVTGRKSEEELLNKFRKILAEFKDLADQLSFTRLKIRESINSSSRQKSLEKEIIREDNERVPSFGVDDRASSSETRFKKAEKLAAKMQRSASVVESTKKSEDDDISQQRSETFIPRNGDMFVNGQSAQKRQQALKDILKTKFNPVCVSDKISRLESSLQSRLARDKMLLQQLEQDLKDTSQQPEQTVSSELDKSDAKRDDTPSILISEQRTESPEVVEAKPVLPQPETVPNLVDNSETPVESSKQSNKSDESGPPSDSSILSNTDTQKSAKVENIPEKPDIKDDEPLLKLPSIKEFKFLERMEKSKKDIERESKLEVDSSSIGIGEQIVNENHVSTECVQSKNDADLESKRKIISSPVDNSFTEQKQNINEKPVTKLESEKLKNDKLGSKREDSVLTNEKEQQNFEKTECEIYPKLLSRMKFKLLDEVLTDQEVKSEQMPPPRISDQDITATSVDELSVSKETEGESEQSPPPEISDKDITGVSKSLSKESKLKPEQSPAPRISAKDNALIDNSSLSKKKELVNTQKTYENTPAFAKMLTEQEVKSEQPNARISDKDSASLEESSLSTETELPVVNKQTDENTAIGMTIEYGSSSEDEDSKKSDYPKEIITVDSPPSGKACPQPDTILEEPVSTIDTGAEVVGKQETDKNIENLGAKDSSKQNQISPAKEKKETTKLTPVEVVGKEKTDTNIENLGTKDSKNSEITEALPDPNQISISKEEKETPPPDNIGMTVEYVTEDLTLPSIPQEEPIVNNTTPAETKEPIITEPEEQIIPTVLQEEKTTVEEVANESKTFSGKKSRFEKEKSNKTKVSDSIPLVTTTEDNSERIKEISVDSGTPESLKKEAQPINKKKESVPTRFSDTVKLLLRVRSSERAKKVAQPVTAILTPEIYNVDKLPSKTSEDTTIESQPITKTEESLSTSKTPVIPVKEATKTDDDNTGKLSNLKVPKISSEPSTGVPEVPSEDPDKNIPVGKTEESSSTPKTPVNEAAKTDDVSFTNSGIFSNPPTLEISPDLSSGGPEVSPEASAKNTGKTIKKNDYLTQKCENLFKSADHAAVLSIPVVTVNTALVENAGLESSKKMRKDDDLGNMTPDLSTDKDTGSTIESKEASPIDKPVKNNCDGAIKDENKFIDYYELYSPITLPENTDVTPVLDSAVPSTNAEKEESLPKTESGQAKSTSSPSKEIPKLGADLAEKEINVTPAVPSTNAEKEETLPKSESAQAKSTSPSKEIPKLGADLSEKEVNVTPAVPSTNAEKEESLPKSESGQAKSTSSPSKEIPKLGADLAEKEVNVTPAVNAEKEESLQKSEIGQTKTTSSPSKRSPKLGTDLVEKERNLSKGNEYISSNGSAENKPAVSTKENESKAEEINQTSAPVSKIPTSTDDEKMWEKLSKEAFAIYEDITAAAPANAQNFVKPSIGKCDNGNFESLDGPIQSDIKDIPPSLDGPIPIQCIKSREESNRTKTEVKENSVNSDKKLTKLEITKDGQNNNSPSFPAEGIKSGKKDDGQPSVSEKIKELNSAETAREVPTKTAFNSKNIDSDKLVSEDISKGKISSNKLSEKVNSEKNTTENQETAIIDVSNKEIPKKDEVSECKSKKCKKRLQSANSSKTIQPVLTVDSPEDTNTINPQKTDSKATIKPEDKKIMTTTELRKSLESHEVSEAKKLEMAYYNLLKDDKKDNPSSSAEWDLKSKKKDGVSGKQLSSAVATPESKDTTKSNVNGKNIDVVKDFGNDPMAPEKLVPDDTAPKENKGKTLKNKLPEKVVNEKSKTENPADLTNNLKRGEAQSTDSKGSSSNVVGKKSKSNNKLGLSRSSNRILQTTQAQEETNKVKSDNSCADNKATKKSEGILTKSDEDVWGLAEKSKRTKLPVRQKSFQKTEEVNSVPSGRPNKPDETAKNIRPTQLTKAEEAIRQEQQLLRSKLPVKIPGACSKASSSDSLNQTDIKILRESVSTGTGTGTNKRKKSLLGKPESKLKGTEPKSGNAEAGVSTVEERIDETNQTDKAKQDSSGSQT